MDKIEINKKIRLIELFAGYGSQAMALRNIGAEFERYKVVEFEKNVLNSYNAIHGTNFPVIDIKNITGKDLEIVEKDKFAYLLTYSFPCTDLSLSGKVAGMERGSGTRSALLWEVEAIRKFYRCKVPGSCIQKPKHSRRGNMGRTFERRC